MVTDFTNTSISNSDESYRGSMDYHKQNNYIINMITVIISGL